MNLKQKIANFLFKNEKVQNNLGNDFLRYGNRDRLVSESAEVEIKDSEMYRGYLYAAIQKRGNKVSSLAKENLVTEVNDTLMEKYQKAEKTPEHPYLKVIRESEKFTERQFWKDISIYLDLAGRYYLGVVRNYIPSKSGGRGLTTDVKEFILLNPYEIRRVVNENGEVAGYIERKKDGRYREWAKHQIIDMRELNPFDTEKQWAMTDAAKESVFAIRQSGDYTRKALMGNLNAPGIISTDVILPDDKFENFRNRVRSHRSGEPIFGNGTGAITWQSMQQDLDKAALLDTNEINRTTLFAVSGTSKTTLGIEQSGTTRETARVQSENFISETVQPRLEDIVDFLNLDYKQHYFNEYKANGYEIVVKSAVGQDYDINSKATAVRQAQFALAQEVISAGYTETSSYQYATGDIELGQLEAEKNPLDTGIDSNNDENNGDDEAPTDDSGNGGNNAPGDINPENTPGQDTDDDSESTQTNTAGQGKVTIKLEDLNIENYLTNGLKVQLLEDKPEPLAMIDMNLPEQDLESIQKTNKDAVLAKLPKELIIESIDSKDNEDYTVIIADIEDIDDFESVKDILPENSESQNFKPYIELCRVTKDADINGFKNALNELKGTHITVQGYKIDNPKTVLDELNEVKCTCEYDGKIYENAVGAEDLAELDALYENTLKEVRKVEKEAVDIALGNVTINSFEESDLVNKKQKNSLIKKLKKIFQNYWDVLTPIIGISLITRRNREFDQNKDFVMTDGIREYINEETQRTAEGHIKTVFDDLLKTSNKVYTSILEDAASQLIVDGYENNPDKYSKWFDSKPTKAEALLAVQRTDILEENRKLYERANQMAIDGYERSKILKAIREEFAPISQKRATLVVRNETSRAYTHAQFEADYEFLNSIGKLDVAYKRLVSRTGHPCEFCQELIDKGDIPFTENFLNYGETISAVDKETGKIKSFTANYENIASGVLHPNCSCQYELIFKDVDKVQNGTNESTDVFDNNLDRWACGNGNPALDKTLEVNGGKGSGNFGHSGRPGLVGGSGKNTITSNMRTKRFMKGDTVSYVNPETNEKVEGIIKDWTPTKPIQGKYGMIRGVILETKNGEVTVPFNSNVKMVKNVDAVETKPSERRTAKQKEALNEVFEMVQVAYKDKEYFLRNMSEETAVALRDELNKVASDVDLSHLQIGRQNGTSNVGKLTTNLSSGVSVLSLSSKTIADGEYFKNKQKESAENGWTTNGTIAGIIRHELGHYKSVRNAYDAMGDGGQLHYWQYNNYESRVIKEALKRIGESGMYSMDKSKLSAYGKTDNSEAIAESWSNPNYSDFTKAVVDVLKEGNITLNNAGMITKNQIQTEELELCDGYPQTPAEWEEIHHQTLDPSIYDGDKMYPQYMEIEE